MKKKKIFVLMSGGVDSSVAALLLKQQNLDVVGIHLKVSPFCNPQDKEDARLVAEALEIPFYVLDITREYAQRIILETIKDYSQGLTPNSDAFCNGLIKFGYVYDLLKKIGFPYIATGHYAQKIIQGKKHYIVIPKDKAKDQTYFLWTIDKERLKNIIFPLGNLTKEEVRKIAQKHGLVIANKKDSQGVCFLGNINLINFIKNFLPEYPGPIYNTQKELLGYHKGYYFFTEGQRHGLNIRRGDGPYYVALKDPSQNILIVAKKEENVLYTKKIKLTKINLLVEKKILYQLKDNEGIKVFTRCRYRQELTPSIFNLHRQEITFLTPVKNVALGQHAVFYSSQGILLGGGVIIKKFTL